MMESYYMEFMSATILSGVLYDCLKHGTYVTASKLKEKFQGWIIDDQLATKLESQVTALKLNDEMSEKAITKHIEASLELNRLLREIRPVAQASVINQVHNGTGDNIAGDKIIKG